MFPVILEKCLLNIKWPEILQVGQDVKDYVCYQLSNFTVENFNFRTQILGSQAGPFCIMLEMPSFSAAVDKDVSTMRRAISPWGLLLSPWDYGEPEDLPFQDSTGEQGVGHFLKNL